MLSSMPSARADRALSSCGPIRADMPPRAPHWSAAWDGAPQPRRSEG